MSEVQELIDEATRLAGAARDLAARMPADDCTLHRDLPLMAARSLEHLARDLR